METVVIVRTHAYYDSVTLMAASRALSQLEGIELASLVMGTAHNKELLRDAGISDPAAVDARPDDLIIALRGRDAALLHDAAAEVDGLLRRGGDGGNVSSARPAPRTLVDGLRRMPEANLALISVPGEFAAREAREALRLGLNVMLFSDNVALEDEVALKQTARREGLLCMGPDCGTAMLGGVVLGFGNAVRRGAVGIVSASGTGAQEISCLLDRWGVGVSQIIGTGGRDLRAEVGGLTALSGIELLAADDATETILLISKPPDPVVASTVLRALAASGKRAVACLLGYSGNVPEGVELAQTLYGGAAQVVGRPTEPDRQALMAQARQLQTRLRGNGGRIKGLFSGGTLRDEAAVALGALGLAERSDLVDYGDDRFTRGRPHPMIDWSARLSGLREAAAGPDTALVLLDIVLGYGAHQDPAGELAPLLDTLGCPVILSVCGAEGDPQGMADQVQRLRAAGAVVAGSNLEAALLAGMTLQP